MDTGDGVATFSYSGTDAGENTGTTISSGETFVIDTTPPPVPTGLAASSMPDGVIGLSWQVMNGDVQSYNLYRDMAEITDSAGLASILSGLTTSQTTDLPPQDGLHYYAVTSVDAVGNESDVSNSPGVQSDRTPPDAPTGLILAVVDEHISAV